MEEFAKKQEFQCAKDMIEQIEKIFKQICTMKFIIDAASHIQSEISDR
jgi:hypothetical protein